MIIDNKIMFGYGDIAVGATVDIITFQQFKPPAECGNHVNDNVEFIGEQIILYISHEEYHELNKYLSSVSNKDISVFTFKDYIFDFSNYNKESVIVVKRKLCQAKNLYILALAC